MATETTDEDQVRLKPFLGMRPGVYLAFIYGFIILIALFFLLVFPGLTRPGSVIALKTEPSGAALRVDGVYMGTSPGKIFVPQGKHTLELVLPGFTPLTLEQEIEGRLFASLIFPKILPLEEKLAAPDPARAFALSAADFAAWSFAGEPTVSYQIPLSLSEGAYRSGPAAAAEGLSEEFDGILRASARFAVTKAAIRDLLRAKALGDNGGLSPSPFTIFRSAEDIIAWLSQEDGAAASLAGVLPAEASSLIAASSWYTKQAAENQSAGKIPEKLAVSPAGFPGRISGASPGGALTLQGISFTGLPGGTLAKGPFRVQVGDFWIADTKTSAAAFERFLNANPQWRQDNLPELIEKGMVNEDYLADNGGISSGNSAGNSGEITAVSWYAAREFCSWLSGFLPPSLGAWEIRLPTETEWEYAAKSSQVSPAIKIAGFQDGNREWCEDPYAPLNLFGAPAGAIAAVGSPERSVRGLSRISAPSSTNLETRGSLPPETCSEFVSFRPLIALRPPAPQNTWYGTP
jgi:formylglycine-generating enzyme required for sulfatase activity